MFVRSIVWFKSFVLSSQNDGKGLQITLSVRCADCSSMGSASRFLASENVPLTLSLLIRRCCCCFAAVGLQSQRLCLFKCWLLEGARLCLHPCLQLFAAVFTAICTVV